jgi:hypothetical protein
LFIALVDLNNPIPYSPAMLEIIQLGLLLLTAALGLGVAAWSRQAGARAMKPTRTRPTPAPLPARRTRATAHISQPSGAPQPTSLE